MTMRAVIIDYNMGNLHSVQRAVEHTAPVGTQVAISSDPDVIRKADRLVFPGQGAARDCMNHLQERGLPEVVHEVIQQRPFLGICMGLQVLLDHSAENGGTDCLGVYAGEVRHFDSLNAGIEQRLKIPQMGWNQIWHRVEHPLWQGIPDGSRFYFVHSYCVDPDDKQLIAGETEYGRIYASVLAQDNVFAMQAHPEKSADDGLKLLENFMSWSP